MWRLMKYRRDMPDNRHSPFGLRWNFKLLCLSPQDFGIDNQGICMPTSTRSSTLGQNPETRMAKRAASEAEDDSIDSRKKSRVDQSPVGLKRDVESIAKRDRDSKRRKKKKKKAPIVTKAPHSQSKTDMAESKPRNVIIRFTSPAPEPSGSRSTPQTTPSFPKVSIDARTSETAVATTDADETGHPTTLEKGKGKATVSPENEVHPITSNPLEITNEELRKELATKNQLIENHQQLISQFQQAITCQICLDLMYKPYALAPCGHLACYDCLVQWFKAPPADGRPGLPAVMRKKTCPHCRALVRERPSEIWGVKSMVQGLVKSELVPIPPLLDGHDANPAPADPWAGIFRKATNLDGAFFPPFVPIGFHAGDDVAPPQGQAADLGMLDMEDGGIYRCLDCMHEIWDGVCTSCGRVYRGHQHDDDEDIAWLEEDFGALDAAEDVDIADDPGWMGLEEGDGDDEEELPPWPHHLERIEARNRLVDLLHGHFADPDDDILGEDVDEDEAEEDDEEGYESYEGSFIDDEHDVGIPRHIPRLSPEVYEISDEDSDEIGPPPPRRVREVVEILSDDEDQPGHSVPRRIRGRVGSALSRGPAIVISDEESDRDELDSDGSGRHRTRRRVRRGVIPSDDDANSGADSGSAHSDHDIYSGLAERVAAIERELYGDDGSLPHRPQLGRSRLSIDEDMEVGDIIDDDRAHSAYDSDQGDGYDSYGGMDPWLQGDGDDLDDDCYDDGFY
ncbi:hypothetical protein BJ138DRAFT_1160228 [Hygrophoropsis aurantiaca]|uniref:Uncharacterized protein n=1 Tax=Hygrophoropsis aurantiaca TaxID=72124 RepID=A0ACB8A2F6_9AGAM|nr:hypothetical protein BJ138DRAFT_1160228 [Hygrophoropsis aurantiaca]